MTNETKQDKREIVIPGEVIASGDFLPGDWTMKQGDDVVSTRLGIVDKSDKLVKVIPISGVYTPRRGNVVIAEITDFTMRGWLSKIGAPYNSFLALNECPMFVRENEMADVHDIGDLVICKIAKTGRTSVDLTIKGRGLGKIRSGIIMKVNPHRVPRIIGKEGSMVRLIKNASGAEVVVGQNGIIWIKGEKTEDELFARQAVEFVVENTTANGLTAKVEDFLEEGRKGSVKKAKEVIEAEPIKEEVEEDTQ
jgi:exosome complex component RRP4